MATPTLLSVCLPCLSILTTCDPNCFASLVLLNRKWRRISQQAQLYAQQLSRCRSYAASHPAMAIPVADDELPTLRRAFAHEVKRNLYEAYLRPQETIIKLVSTSISSSAAFPGGEAFHFAFSSNGQYVLAYSTSRIHVLHFVDSELTVGRELKILRRPASVAILDDGSILAVLSTDHQVDLYDLSNGKAKHIRAIALDHHPRTISLSPGGSVLAAAYDGGIEVYSLASTASATDRRGVKSDAADALSFSKDGTQLLGTTLHSKTPSTVILTAPYFNPGEHAPEDSVGQLWTTSILFPNSSRDCSHAVLLPSSTDYEANWMFTYDRVFETFRAVRVDDLRNGTTYFTGPVADVSSSSKLLPTTLPSSTGSGDLVAAGFQGNEIWCYGVPEDLDAPPEMTQSTVSYADADSGTLATSRTPKISSPGPGLRGSHTWPKDPKDSRIPQWQILCDSSRNAFIEGRHVSSLDGITGLKWMTTPSESSNERLIASAPGGVGHPPGQSFETNEDGIAPMDGGRLSLLDFSYSIVNGQKRTVTIEVGEKDPEVLEEEHRDIETEVAIVRRRTVAQSRGKQRAVLRSVRVAAHSDRGPGSNVSSRFGSSIIPAVPRRSSVTKVPLPPMEERSETASMASVDDQEALDAPYAHGAPRSGNTLRRAATAAAVNRVLHPPRVGTQEPARIRPADGRNELPHESDADNWVPPPPPYSKDAIPPLPEHLRNAIPVGITASPNTLRRSSTQRSSASTDSSTRTSLHRSRTTYASIGRSPPILPPVTIARPTSSSSAVSASSDPIRGTQASWVPRNNDDFDDMYDVSPTRTPEPVVAVPLVSSPISQMPRRLVAQPIVDTVPEIPVMNIPTTDPVSPIPRQAALNMTVQNISAITEQWDGADNSSHSITISEGRRPLSSGPAMLTTTRLDAAMPARPNHDHHIMELPPVSPMSPLDLFPPVDSVSPSQPPVDSRPVSLPPVSEMAPVDLNLPSASQLARLNSRTGRPNSLDGSGIFHQPQINSSIYQNAAAGASIPMNMGPHTNQPNYGPPRAAFGAYGSQAHVSAVYPPTPPVQKDIGRRVSQRGGPLPNMPRLETIQSVDSAGDQAAYVPNRPSVHVGVSRQTSRAGRSAAINIKEAKRKGWRGTMKRKSKKKKDRDAASSAGWTDVSRDSIANAPDQKKRYGGGKCMFM